MDVHVGIFKGYLVEQRSARQDKEVQPVSDSNASGIFDLDGVLGYGTWTPLMTARALNRDQVAHCPFPVIAPTRPSERDVAIVLLRRAGLDVNTYPWTEKLCTCFGKCSGL